ncbi:zf-HC2 domain-containing protein [Schinkia azotoformans]|uniref:anti-sigma factor family protein n=1 Tax=Schinkia azotoformans TaxID=1454 RepID=UPI002E1DB877|nr:zf-HC2 domain-containing protein [Schinkia azotoformans]
MQERHILVKELLSLYIDDMVDSKAKEIIEEHLQECDECRAELTGLRDDKDFSIAFHDEEINEDNTKQSEVAFITRVSKYRKKIMLYITAFLLSFTIGSWYLSKERAEEKWQAKQNKANQELVKLDSELVSLSPPQEQIMKNSGLNLQLKTKQISTNETIFSYTYQWSNPNIDFVQEDIYWPNTLIAMDLTNNTVLTNKENKSNFGNSILEETWTLSGIEKNTEFIGVELPNLAVFYKTSDLSFPLQQGKETVINKEISINNVRFLIEKASVEDSKINVYYKQLDEISKVGLYELSFNITDENEKNWSKEPKIDFQNDKQRIFSIPIYKDMKSPLTLNVKHAVLIIPGMHYKFMIS